MEKKDKRGRPPLSEKGTKTLSFTIELTEARRMKREAKKLNISISELVRKAWKMYQQQK